MNKSEFIAAIAKNAKITKVDARKSLNAFIKTVQETVRENEKVSIQGFGSFSILTRSTRKGVNPRNNKPISIPERKVVKFKPGTGLVKILK